MLNFINFLNENNTINFKTAKLLYHTSKSRSGIVGKVRFTDGFYGVGFYCAIEEKGLPFQGIKTETLLIASKKPFKENWYNQYRNEGSNNEQRTQKLLENGFDSIVTGEEPFKWVIAIKSPEQVVKVTKESTYNSIFEEINEYFKDENLTTEFLKENNISDKINELKNNNTETTTQETLTVYHGTRPNYIESIKNFGLEDKTSSPYQQGWYMVSSDFESALFHAYADDNKDYVYVIEFEIPLIEDEIWVGYPYLWTGGKRSDKSTWFALKQKLPKEFIKTIHKVDYKTWLECKSAKRF